MNESLIYSYKEAGISNKHLIAYGKKYPLDTILSVELRTLKPNRWLSRLLMFTGLPLLFGHATLPFLGFVLILMGLLHWRFAALHYAIVIRTLSGKHQILVSENLQHINNLTSALNVARGLREIM